jgi:hypothetical protein
MACWSTKMCTGLCAVSSNDRGSTSTRPSPQLTRTNYTEWSLIMMVNLQVARLWDIIESDADNYHEDRSALAAILRVMPQEMQMGLAVKSMTHDAWEAIRKVCLSADQVKEANT